MEVRINGESTEEAIEREYAKGPGNMNLPAGKNVVKKLIKDGKKANPDMTAEEERNLVTQSKLAPDKEQMSQLVDRLETNSFQG